MCACAVRQRWHVCVRSHEADRHVRRYKSDSGQRSGALRAVCVASVTQYPHRAMSVKGPILLHAQMGRAPGGGLLREEGHEEERWRQGRATRAVAEGLSRRRVHVGRVLLRVPRTGCVLLWTVHSFATYFTIHTCAWSCAHSNNDLVVTVSYVFIDSWMRGKRHLSSRCTIYYRCQHSLNTVLCARAVLQFGYLVMFAAACPLVALVMFVSNVVELRLDAIKLLRYVERPVPERTSNIGIWNSILNMLFICAIVTNVCEHWRSNSQATVLRIYN